MMKVQMQEIETWLYAYPMWQRKLSSLRVQLKDYPHMRYEFVAVASFAKGKQSDTTYDAVERRMEIEEEKIQPLEFKIRLLENALSVLTEEEMAFVRLKYFEKKNNAIAWETLFLSRRAFFRKRVTVLEKVYEALGGDGAPIWDTGTQVTMHH
ncbi:hypothetical protein [Alicyclobacillus sp. ALC3]|uniref:hypothetical protein n=1 Tax=Alicyclobacillus sp. ALC3 TaxID=2796143 RepID=UPI0019D4C4B8|nr:hypothetical protein [Alicyclobacillus sp. ALC3]QSO53146.1 hypothetical protein JZ785_04460 [Alicyclobacillus curvatus]WDL96486.1 hypothetical protein JC200_19545 [Alicyclobacillus sp. ALC3]